LARGHGGLGDTEEGSSGSAREGIGSLEGSGLSSKWGDKLEQRYSFLSHGDAGVADGLAKGWGVSERFMDLTDRKDRKWGAIAASTQLPLSETGEKAGRKDECWGPTAAPTRPPLREVGWGWHKENPWVPTATSPSTKTPPAEGTTRVGLGDDRWNNAAASLLPNSAELRVAGSHYSRSTAATAPSQRPPPAGSWWKVEEGLASSWVGLKEAGEGGGVGSEEGDGVGEARVPWHQKLKQKATLLEDMKRKRVAVERERWAALQKAQQVEVAYREAKGRAEAARTRAVPPTASAGKNLPHS